MSRTSSTALSLATLALLTGGWYGAGQATAAPAHPAPAAVTAPAATSTHAKVATTIRIHNYHFHVRRTVHPGQVVKVVNRDGTTHSVTRNAPGFSVIVPAHSSRTFRAPSATGDYKFHCMFHSTMHGTLKVR